MRIKAELKGRDSVEVELRIQNGKIEGTQIKVLGCFQMLSEARSWTQAVRGKTVEQIEVPVGQAHTTILMRELVLKLKSQWHPPYTDHELCHCRGIPTQIVDQAIIAGAHNVDQIAHQTSAGSACGSCRPDSQRLIHFRTGIELKK